MALITKVVAETDDLRTLSAALIVSGIDEQLSQTGPYTFFAPNEDAFSEMGVDALVALAANREDLANTLRCHVVAGLYRLSDLTGEDQLRSIAGTELFVSIGEDDESYVEEARIIRGDLPAENGIIHLIDLVILPLPADSAASEDVAIPGDADAPGIVRYAVATTVFDHESDAPEDDERDSVAV
jgi:uncharacterized surface protein with fasciclin (FAS1) repeats